VLLGIGQRDSVELTVLIWLGTAMNTEQFSSRQPAELFEFRIIVQAREVRIP